MGDEARLSGQHMKGMRKVGRTRVYAVGAALLLWSATAAAGPLFEAPDRPLSPEQTRRLQSDPLVVPGRYRLARMDRDEILRSLEVNLPLVFNLFSDVEMRADVQKVKELAGGSSFISGSLEDGGHFTVFLHESGIVRGELHSIRGVFTLKSQGHDYSQVLIKQADLSELPRCGNEAVEHLENHDMGTDWIPASAGITGNESVTKKHHLIPKKTGISSKQAANTVDVLVVYTQRVEDHEGGPTQVRAAIENEVAKMNQVLDNSRLSYRQIKLVHMEKVDYAQRDSVFIDINNLTHKSMDNYNDNDFSALDEVHELREKHQADLVHLFVEEARGACGIASGTYALYQNKFIEQHICQGSLTPSACLELERRKEWKSLKSFSASAIKCTNYTFAHELGHTLGLWHDRADYNWDPSRAEDSGPFRPYAFGHENLNFTEKCQITVMSAGNKCINEGIYGQIRVPYFSNPDLFFPIPDGHSSSSFDTNTPMGVPGDEYTIDLDGPVNASKAVDDVWDIVASLSDPIDDPPPTIGACFDGTPANALSSLDGRTIEIPPEGGTRELIVSFPVADGCSNVRPEARSSDAFISSNVEILRQGEYRLVISTSPDDRYSCAALSGRVTVDVPGVSHINPAHITVTQESSNAFCRSVAQLPEDSVALDLSGQNSLASLQLAGGMFARFTELESMDLSRNRLRTIYRGVFEGLEELLDLDLSENVITLVAPSVFEDIPNLANLDLSHNQLEEFDDNLFPILPDGAAYALTHLDLSHNRLQSIPFLSVLWNLETLNLSDNRISDEIYRSTFFGKESLKELNLSRNAITRLDDQSFHGNGELAFLWLHSNDITNVHSGAFEGLSELQALSLSRNQLTELPEATLADLTALEHLWLYRNRLTDLPAGLFSGLSSLRTLSLSGNQLTSVPDGLFSDLAALEQLWLLDNGITAIASGTFEGLSSVLSLSLSGNQLTSLPNRSFSDTPNLEALWLYGNGISEIASNAFEGLSNLRYLDISNNPLSESLPASVCSFLDGVDTLRAEGVDLDAVCPQWAWP